MANTQVILANDLGLALSHANQITNSNKAIKKNEKNQINLMIITRHMTLIN